MGTVFSQAEDGHFPPHQLPSRKVLCKNLKVITNEGLSDSAHTFATAYLGLVDHKPAEIIKTIDSREISKEITFLTFLHHPNIISPLFTFDECEIKYLVYEPFLTTLSAAYNPGIHDYTDIVSQLTEGVAYLQRKNVVHMTLTTENVHISSDAATSVVKIADFRFAIELRHNAMSVPSNLPKNKMFLAPEILSQTAVYLSSDIYSLGMIISCMNLINNKSIRTMTSSAKAVFTNDLVRKLMLYIPHHRLKIDEIKKHPFFWDSDKIVLFLIEINKQIEERDANFKYCLLRNSTDVLDGDDWTSLIEQEVMQGLTKAKNSFHGRPRSNARCNSRNNIIALISAIRHVAVHSQASNAIRTVMGTNEKLVDYWLGKFPQLIQHVYNAKIDFEQGNYRR